MVPDTPGADWRSLPNKKNKYPKYYLRYNKEGAEKQDNTIIPYKLSRDKNNNNGKRFDGIFNFYTLRKKSTLPYCVK